MTVYVDNAFIPYGSMKMCHMVADTKAELLAMVDKIGVKRKWIQHEGTYKEHFDICIAKRSLAIQHGAQQLTQIQLGRMLASRLKNVKN